MAALEAPQGGGTAPVTALADWRKRDRDFIYRDYLVQLPIAFLKVDGIQALGTILRAQPHNLNPNDLKNLESFADREET